MSQDPDKPLDSGRIGLPPTDSAMNKIAPASTYSEKQKGSITMQVGKGDAAEDLKILTLALKRFDHCSDKESDNRKSALNDLKMKDGEGQWSTDVAAQRRADNRPMLTTNKLPVFVNQIVNDNRQNRPAINISPVGDKSDVEVAKVYRGLIRAIERDSDADIAYDTAFDNEVSAGWGDVRITTEYEASKSFNQKLVLKRIRNMFSVYRDPAHQDPTGCDARYLFISEMIPREEFKDHYPDADQMPWDRYGAGDALVKNWMNSEEIRIAEYYTIDTEVRTLVKLDNGFVGYKDELDKDVLDRHEVVQERETEIKKVMWYKLTAKEILERTEWPGTIIPVVKFVGNEIDIEGKVKYSGIIRNAKDPQRMYNYMRTLAVEVTALQPKAPWVMEEGQVAGHEQQWKNANTISYPYLLYKGVDLSGKPAPPPQRQQFLGAPNAILAEVQAAQNDMMATTGIRFDATPQERMYDESGRALRELRERGDITTFHYVDNFARSLRQIGEILVELIPIVYDTKRVVTILREDDKEEAITLDPHLPKPMERQVNPQTNAIMKIYNPTYGKYGVTATIGPSYATKRVESAESMMDFLRALGPQFAPIIADLIAKNQDWSGSEEIAARLAKAVDPKLLTPDVKDVPPQLQAVIQNLQMQLQQISQQNAMLQKVLTDQNADRAVRQDKQDKDFEAKLLAIAQKADAAATQHIGSQLKDLAQAVHMLHTSLRADEGPENA